MRPRRAWCACGRRSAVLRELVEALPERLRRVVLLYYFEELSPASSPGAASVTLPIG